MLYLTERCPDESEETPLTPDEGFTTTNGSSVGRRVVSIVYRQPDGSSPRVMAIDISAPGANFVNIEVAGTIKAVRIAINHVFFVNGFQALPRLFAAREIY